MTVNHLRKEEYNEYYAHYIGQVPENTPLIEALNLGKARISDFFNSLSIEKHEYRYEENKWTPKEVLLHLIDTERIFTYRALRFARKDLTNLPGFDQDDFIPPSKANSRSMASLVQEYVAVREATVQTV